MKDKKINLQNLFREWGMLAVIIVIVLVASLRQHAFLQPSNLINILRSYSTIGIAALGMAYTVIGGGMDLSISSTVSFSAVVTMLIINGTSFELYSPAYATFLAFLAGAAVGALVGSVAGLIMAAVNGRMGEAFIITYALQIIVASVANGVVVRFCKFIVFVILGFSAGLAGLMFICLMRAGSVLYGTDLALTCVAATVVGGTPLSGGKGGVPRTVVGILLLYVIYKGLGFPGLAGYVNTMVKGILLLLVVSFDAFLTQSGTKTA